MDFEIDELGGNCPVQGTGTINGCPWYFRARTGMMIYIADRPESDPLGDDPGWIWSGTDDPRFQHMRNEELTVEFKRPYFGWITEEQACEILETVMREFVGGVRDRIGGWERMGDG